MEMLLTSSLVTAESLLYELCQTFGYEDTLVSQEAINKHFSRLNGLAINLDSEYQSFADKLAILFESKAYIVGYIVYLKAGPQLQFEDYVLHFPKIIARTVDGNVEHLKRR